MADYGHINTVRFLESKRQEAGMGYDKLLGIANHLRSLDLPGKDLISTPDEKVKITSAVNSQGLELHLYHPSSLTLPSTTKRPAMITWHGSGFIIPALGAYGNFCRHMADRISATAIDADYVKAPEHPYPQPIADCVAAVRWSLRQDWCNGEIILVGFSAGGLFALTLSNPDLATSHGLTHQEIAAIKAVVAIYAPVDLASPVSTKPIMNRELPMDIAGSILSHEFMQIGLDCYFYGVDKSTQQTAMASPQLADPASFTTPMILVTAEHDPLRPEMEKFYEDVKMATGLDNTLFQAKGVGHGYEIRLPDVDSEGVENVPGAATKKEVYGLLTWKLKSLLGSR